MTEDTQERRGLRMKPHISVVLVVVLVAALLACAAITYSLAAQKVASFQSQPTSVHIIRVPGNEPTFQVVPLDRTITDTSQVQHLYQTILNLPVSCGCAACVADPEAYILTFNRNSQVVLTVRAHTGMCWNVDLDRGNPKDTREFRSRQATPAFWSELSHELGIPRSELVPVPS